ncbi:MAG: branched-chain amino acid ABC transporter permease, partial [Anaerolineae bacterium]|nr:branched-chain amino acid ABC transporter permease [Anaerolineae bacterium]
IRDRATAGAALTAGVVVLIARVLPFHLDLLVAALSGVVAGIVLDRRQHGVRTPVNEEAT